MDLKIFKIKKSFKKGGLGLRPNTGWKIILYVAFVIILGSFVFGFNLFMQTNKEFVASVANTGEQIKIVKKERIQKVLEYFSLREKKSVEILNSPLPIVDPSL